MKIVNDKIYIVQGETPTYDVDVYDRKTGIPYMVSDDIETPIVEFIVRPSLYAKDADYNLKKYKDFSDIKKFSFIPKKMEEIPSVTINEIETNYKPSTGHENELHVYSHDNVNEFYYWDGSKWNKYVFNINFKMEYDYTSKMEAKTYKYEVVIFDATPVKDGEEIIRIDNIKYKKPLLSATDFIVEGSMSD